MRNLLDEFTRDSENTQISRVVIIGGGAAGLSVLGALKRRKNCEVVLIEKEAHVGGIWYLCDYPGLSIHARSFSFRFYNYHKPHSVTQHATRNEILSYLNSYVTHFDLADQIFPQRQAVKINYFENEQMVHKCNVEVEELESRDRIVLRCDYVICALGFTNAGAPHVPDFSKNGADFKGTILHSSGFNDALLAKIKTQKAKVCLLGAGKSAYDIALQFAKRAMCDQTTWVYKKFLWGLNYDFIYSNRPDKFALMEKHVKYLYLRRRVQDLLSLEPLAEELIRGGLVLNIEDNLNLHETRYAIYKLSEMSELKSKITRIKSSVESLGSSFLKLENGQAVDADYIICCTGYSRAKNLPEVIFHPKAGVESPINPRDQPLLYRSMIDLRMPRMIFFTGEVLFTAQLFGYSIAAEWVSQYLANFTNSTLADIDAMKMRVVEDDAAINANVKPDCKYSWVPQGMTNYGYFGGEASFRYLTQILADLGFPDKAVLALYYAAEKDGDFEGIVNFFRKKLGLRLGQSNQADRAVAAV